MVHHGRSARGPRGRNDSSDTPEGALGNQRSRPGRPRRPRSVLSFSPSSFGWDSATIATLRHSTLPWFDGKTRGNDLHGVPLTGGISLGSRERLSLVAQFAAHLAFLQFAGLSVGEEVDADEWVVVRARGRDIRLVRVAVRPAKSTAPPFTLIQQFASAVEAPQVEILRQPWGRAEAVYAECRARVRNAATADLTSLNAAAAGTVLGGGAEWLRALCSRRGARTTCGAGGIAALEAMATIESGIALAAFQGRSILRYGALGALQTIVGPLETLRETEIVERTAAIAAGTHLIFVQPQDAAIDEASRRVIQMLASLPGVTWVTIDPQAEETRRFVLSTRLAAREQLETRARHWSEEDLKRFIAAPAYDNYLACGAVPDPAPTDVAIDEPQRSYLAALALAGRCVPRALAEDLVREFLFVRPLEELQVSGVAMITNGSFYFESEAMRVRVASMNPPETRAALCRAVASVAARSGDRRLAAKLLLDAGETGEALQLLQTIDWNGEQDVIELLGRVPADALRPFPALTWRLACALVENGRYRAARDLASRLEPERAELLLATIERRLGDYATSLRRLERLPPSLAADLLRADLFIVARREEEARELLARAQPESDDDVVRLGYMRSLLDRDAGEGWRETHSPLVPYYAARLMTYRALDASDFETAIARAAEAVAASRSIVQRIDAELDSVFALFTAGRWADARAAAMEALAEVEETDGDRAAGGLLFLLAYLCADDGQWAHAGQRIERLRQFYSITSDDRHLIEIDLLTAQLHFARGQFVAARETAARLLTQPGDPPVREAALLIVAEVDWLRCGATVQLEQEPANRELRDRARLIDGREPEGAFNRLLASWVREKIEDPPVASSGAETLKLFRAALARARHRNDERAASIAAVIAEELSLEIGDSMHVDAATPAERELLILQAAARTEYPFGAALFGGAAWRFTHRNRLGQWNQIGSAATVAGESLDALIGDPAPDWIVCSPRELLYVEGSSEWSSQTRDALAGLVRSGAELHRLRRLFEEEDPGAGSSSKAVNHGILGDSPLMRQVLGVIDRIAQRDVAVCIRGESGTGKELVAHALHRGSSRKSKPFVAVNCAALPEHLIESELFGHVRGAFTGADRDRIGLISAADEGTLFLDEVGEMPLAAQAKLLRFLQDGELRRVGDVVRRAADVRILSATNRPLEAAVEEGRFREDLYYRIKVVEIVMPPLRDRHRDVALLASAFLAEECARHRSGPQRLSPDVDAVFDSYSWPGNVRELQNTIRAAHALAGEAREIDLEHLPDRLRTVAVNSAIRGSYHDAVARFRRDLIEKSLAQTRGNQSRAADLLRISRQALAYQIRELGILVEPPRSRAVS